MSGAANQECCTDSKNAEQTINEVCRFHNYARKRMVDSIVFIGLYFKAVLRLGIFLASINVFEIVLLVLLLVKDFLTVDHKFV
ncbi:MAG: hypothetical protein AAGD25_38635, partial [Cyanobacteria bacterium P01_F01_bin.150]